MEGSLRLYREYRDRSLLELNQVKELADKLLPTTIISRIYYAAYYAMKAQLTLADITTKSHKQTLIEFRRNFVKSGLLGREHSKLLTKVFEWRELADYDIIWSVPADEFNNYLKEIYTLIHKIIDIDAFAK